MLMTANGDLDGERLIDSLMIEIQVVDRPILNIFLC